MLLFFFQCSADHRNQHVLTHSSPTRRSSVLSGEHLYPAFPYPSYTLMSEADMLAIKGYIFSLPPVRRENRAHDLDKSEEHTSELQSLMRSSYAVFCLKKKNLKSMATIYTPISSNHILLTYKYRQDKYN